MEVLTHSILPFAGILFALIVIHESGHYFTAKLFGVKVLEAGIGIPPKAWSFQWHDTEYSVNWLPMGAFVRMLGEEDPSHPESLAAQPKWKRTIIIGSGAFLNLVLAIALFSVSQMVPRTVSDAGAQIAEVVAGSPAEQAGLRPGDEILEIEGREVSNTGEAVYIVQLNQGSHVDFVVRRRDAIGAPQIVRIDDVYARWDPPDIVDECGIRQGSGMTGIKLAPAHLLSRSWTPDERVEFERDARQEYEKHKKKVAPGSPAQCYSPEAFAYTGLSEPVCAALDGEDEAQARALKAELFAEAPAACYQFNPGFATEHPTKRVSSAPWVAVPKGFQQAFESLILTRNQVWSLARGFGGAPVTGPVGIAQATGEIVEVAGWRYLIEFAASISMGLAILNFLPIPMVDGGRLVFIAIEFVRRGKRIAPEKEALVHFAGFIAMILLFLMISYFDIARIARGDSLLR